MHLCYDLAFPFLGIYFTDVLALCKMTCIEEYALKHDSCKGKRLEANLTSVSLKAMNYRTVHSYNGTTCSHLKIMEKFFMC